MADDTVTKPEDVERWRAALQRLGVPLPAEELGEIAVGRTLLERWLKRARETPA